MGPIRTKAALAIRKATGGNWATPINLIEAGNQGRAVAQAAADDHARGLLALLRSGELAGRIGVRGVDCTPICKFFNEIGHEVDIHSRSRDFPRKYFIEF